MNKLYLAVAKKILDSDDPREELTRLFQTINEEVAKEREYLQELKRQLDWIKEGSHD